MVKIHFESVFLSLLFRPQRREPYSFASFHFCCNHFTLWIASVKGKFEQKKVTTFKEEKIEKIICITSASSVCPISFYVLEKVGFPKVKENEDPLGYVLYPTDSKILPKICFSFS